MIAWNPFKRPVQRANLEAWCKLLDDIVKGALLAIPVAIYSSSSLELKLLNLTLLGLWIYICTVTTTTIRNGLHQEEK